MKQNDQYSSKGFWRSAGYFILFLIVFILLVQILINTVAEPKLKNKIESTLAGKSQSLTAKVENLDISLFRRQIKVENAILYRRDSLHSSPRSRVFIDSLSVPGITVSGIQVWPFLVNDNLKIHSVSISKPFLKAFKTSIKSTGKSKNRKIRKLLYKQINSFADALKINEFSIESFSAIVTDSLASSKQTGNLENFSLQLSDIRIDSSSPSQRKRLPVSALSGSADSFQWKSSSEMYKFSSRSFLFSSEDSLLSIKDFKIKPLYPKYKFSRIVGHETDRVDLDIETVEVAALDLSALIAKQKVIGSSINLTNSDLEVFHSKRPPWGEIKKKVFPHLLFRQLKIPVKLDSVVVTNADITYSEHKNGVPKPGTVTFENTHAVIKNLNNTANQEPITMDTSTKVMGAGAMKVSFSFPPNPSGTHYINGSVGSMDMKELNPVFKYLALVQIKSGKIDSIDFQMELGPHQSKGTLKMDYSNLYIKMIDFGTKGNKNKDPVKSFLANSFVIDEKDEPPLGEAQISFERVLHKAISNYWWKSLLSGLKNSIGA